MLLSENILVKLDHFADLDFIRLLDALAEDTAGVLEEIKLHFWLAFFVNTLDSLSYDEGLIVIKFCLMENPRGLIIIPPEVARNLETRRRWTGSLLKHAVNCKTLKIY